MTKIQKKKTKKPARKRLTAAQMLPGNVVTLMKAMIAVMKAMQAIQARQFAQSVLLKRLAQKLAPELSDPKVALAEIDKLPLVEAPDVQVVPPLPKITAPMFPEEKSSRG